MQCELAVIIYDGMSGIGSTLETNDNVRFFSQHIGNLTFSFISPVCSNNSFNHLVTS